MNKRFFKTHNILPSKHTLQPYSILSTTIKSEMVQCFIENRKKKSHDIVCCFFVDIQNLVIKICSLFIPCFKSGVEEKLSRQSGLAVKIIRGGPWRRKPKKITTRLSKENEAMRRRDAQVSDLKDTRESNRLYSLTVNMGVFFILLYIIVQHES